MDSLESQGIAPVCPAERMRVLCASLTLIALAHGAVGQAPPMPTELSSEEVIVRVAPSVAVVLTGAGAGRLSGVGSGIIVRSDGVLLTAYHVIKRRGGGSSPPQGRRDRRPRRTCRRGRATRRGGHSYSGGKPACSGSCTARRGTARRTGLYRFLVPPG